MKRGWLKLSSMLRKIRSMSPQARRIAIEATLLLAGIRVLLPIVGLKNLRRLLKAECGPGGKVTQIEVKELLGIVTKASRICVVGSTCLTRALAGQYLLRKAGIESNLCIGVMRDDQQNFQAHAWLEKDRKVVLGGSDEEIRQWVPLNGIDERTA